MKMKMVLLLAMVLAATAACAEVRGKTGKELGLEPSPCGPDEIDTYAVQVQSEKAKPQGGTGVKPGADFRYLFPEAPERCQPIGGASE